MLRHFNLLPQIFIVSSIMLNCLSVARAEGEDAQIFLLPRDLVEIASKQDCFQYTKFYDVVGWIEPPYMYGVAAGSEEHSAAFWCQRGDRDFALMFMQMGQSGPEYAGEIRTRNLPSGLSKFDVDETAATEGFREIQADGYTLPADQRLNGIGILSTYDGAGLAFINFNGKWYRRLVH